jgi:hypothetical protein
MGLYKRVAPRVLDTSNKLAQAGHTQPAGNPRAGGARIWAGHGAGRVSCR